MEYLIIKLSSITTEEELAVNQAIVTVFPKVMSIYMNILYFYAYCLIYSFRFI